MSRVLIPPKVFGETRVDQIDFSPDILAGQVAGVATVSVSVYSGIDASPPAFGITNSGYIAYVTTSGGLAGVIYSVRVTLPVTNPSALLVKTYYLAVIPDLP